MKHLILLFLIVFTTTLFAQGINTVYRNHKDSTQNYDVVIPTKGAINGLLVLNQASLSDSVQQKASEMGIMTLTLIPTSNYLLNLTSDSVLVKIGEMISEVVANHKIPRNKVIIGGMSAAGTGAIRYAQYSFSNKLNTVIKPIGVFAVDPPLDYERLWNEAEKSVQRNFNKDAVDEGKTLMKLLNESLHGTPKTNIKSYRNNSPFSYSAINGGKAYLLNTLAVRLYIEPDITWWMENRRKDYYDINAVDNASLINQLKLNGNSKAELIVTNNRGYRQNGDRHPHSWSILDENELLLWCVKIFSSSE